MSLRRFKRIRGAFHQMNRRALYGGDKCYQLRNALNFLNQAALQTFLPSGNLAFDEGGVVCRSRLWPVRQYNKDKPDKYYRVDFFTLADSKHTNIQGKPCDDAGHGNEWYYALLFSPLSQS